MGQELTNSILELYSENLTAAFSINQIATKLDKKYPYINKKVTGLIKEKKFNRIIVGRSHLCYLNLKNDETICLLTINEIQKKKKELIAHPKLEKATEYILKISRLTNTELVLKLKNKIIFVTSKKEDKEALENSILKTALLGYDYEAITKEDLLRFLKEDQTIHQEKIILTGFEKYYNCIREIEDELKLKYSKLIP